jgi:CRP-like cAMP-binding protein
MWSSRQYNESERVEPFGSGRFLQEGGTMFVDEAQLFQGVSQETMAQISKIMVEESSDRGSLIFSEGDRADSFYVLLRGKVQLGIGDVSEMGHILTRSGEAFGWSSLVDRTTYTAHAECVTPATYIRMDTTTLTRILEENPHDGMLVYKRLAAAVGERLVNAYKAVLSGQEQEQSVSFGSRQVSQAAEM